jgi:leucyl aminopeptidase
LAVFCDDALEFGPSTRKVLGTAAGLIKRAAETNRFKGKNGSVLDILSPQGLKAKRLLVVGTGKFSELKEHDFLKLGGIVAGKLKAGREALGVIAELPKGPMSADQAAAVASGIRLRGYIFDRYKTRKKDGEDAKLRADVSIAVGDVAAAKKAFAPSAYVVDGVITARDLVNEPPNVLFPIEFARRAGQLRKLGVAVDVLDVSAMKKLGMGALLGVSQGSSQPGRTVVMRWNGGKRGEQPVAFIGKGVCFDTGGISIKPAGSMEDMKGDMGGAACVVGLMQALAARKAKANVVGAIGLVENMPDGNAQRPGDIVTSMSGQTIEIINTDAEGRLVLADGIMYAKQLGATHLIDAATLTGAVAVALGQINGGIFANDEDSYGEFMNGLKVSGERFWRLPVEDDYRDVIKSTIADIKNTGGRYGGAINAAMFLKEFAEDTPWLHLDIAAVAWVDDPKPWSASGPTGVAVRSVVEWVRRFAR